jgi:hypothetical protein
VQLLGSRIPSFTLSCGFNVSPQHTPQIAPLGFHIARSFEVSG